MSERDQHNLQSLTAPAKSLLIVAAVVCLLTTFATRAFSFGLGSAQRAVAAEAAAEVDAETSTVAPSPTATPSAVAEAPTEPPAAETTPEPVDDRPTAAATAALTQHVVQEGDTLEAECLFNWADVETLVNVHECSVSPRRAKGRDPHARPVGPSGEGHAARVGRSGRPPTGPPTTGDGVREANSEELSLERSR